MRQNKYEYDAFISHAVEDKIPIANELCAKLERAGLKIWYSGKELGIGDSIEKTIEKGLHRSRYGIVILSPTYLAKNWTIREFYTLLAKEIEEHKVILPVLYNITLDDLRKKDLLMADRFAVHADRGIDFVVDRLVREIRKSKVEAPKMAWLSRIWFVLILSLLANVGLLLRGAFQTESVLIAPPERDNNLVKTQLLTPTLLEEMQSLVNQVSACDCGRQDDHQQAGFQSLPVSNRQARFQLAGNVKPSERAAANRTSLRKDGRKMTMAVVFQIETPAEDSDFNDEMDEVLETIGLADREDPYLAVSHARGKSEKPHHGCVPVMAASE